MDFNKRLNPIILNSVAHIDENRTRFFKVENVANGVPEIFIYDMIDRMFGISAAMIAEVLNDLAREPEILVRINSNGGDSMQGFAIFNHLREFPGKVNVSIDGEALSAASVVAMAGDHISIASNAFMMGHKPYTVISGNDEDMLEMHELLKKVGGAIAKSYADQNRKDMTEADAMAFMIGPRGKGTWLNADEALERGFVDEITESLRIAAHFDPEQFGGEEFIPKQFINRSANPEQRAADAVALWNEVTGG